MARLLAVAVAFVVYTSAERVQVQIFLESGCPYCSKYLTGPLKNALADKDVAALMDVSISPFGNAYFVTEDCQAAASNASSLASGHYDIGMRNCFNKKCGSRVAQHPADCFTGKLVCQHGPKECAFNRYFACAKSLSPKSPSVPYLPFITCMESGYEKNTGSEPDSTLVSFCAGINGIATAELQSCYDGKAGDEAIKKEAMATPEHPGVPFVVVNTQPAKENYGSDALTTLVRSASKGSPSFLMIGKRAIAKVRADPEEKAGEKNAAPAPAVFSIPPAPAPAVAAPVIPTEAPWVPKAAGDYSPELKDAVKDTAATSKALRSATKDLADAANAVKASVGTPAPKKEKEKKPTIVITG